MSRGQCLSSASTTGGAILVSANRDGRISRSRARVRVGSMKRIPCSLLVATLPFGSGPRRCVEEFQIASVLIYRDEQGSRSLASRYSRRVESLLVAGLEKYA